MTRNQRYVLNGAVASVIALVGIAVGDQVGFFLKTIGVVGVLFTGVLFFVTGDTVFPPTDQERE